MSQSNSSRGSAPSLLGLGAGPRARLKRIFILAASVGASVWIWHWVSTDDEGNPIAAPSDEPSLEIEDLKSFLVRRDGKPLWEIKAKRVTMSADRLTTVATGVKNGTLFRDGRPYLHVAAQRVQLFNGNNHLEASGEVSASGPDGFSFKTARATWNPQTQLVECPKPVRALLRGLTFDTKRLSYNWEKGVMKCPDPVEVRAPGAVLRGKNMEATLKTRQVKLSGGVEMIFDPRVAKFPLSASSPTPSPSTTPGQ